MESEVTTSADLRTGTVERNTLETKISLRLNVDGTGQYHVSTGIRFFDHMLESFAKHGGFDLDLTCKGDLDVDQHHTVEDVGIALGEAFEKALGDKRGILRAGYFVMAMDETLAVAAVDLSGRVACVVDDQLTHAHRRRPRHRTRPRLLRRLRPRSQGQRPRQNHVRPQQSPQDRSHLQGLRARHARRLLPRRAHARPAPQHERPAVKIELSNEARKEAITSIKRYFEENLPEPIGDLPAGLLLNFILEEIGPVIYNKAIHDAQARLQQRVSDLDGELFADEFQYWTKAGKRSR